MLLDNYLINSNSISVISPSWQVLKETLRLFPPVTGTTRKSPEDFTCAGHRVPADTMLFVSIWVTMLIWVQTACGIFVRHKSKINCNDVLFGNF